MRHLLFVFILLFPLVSFGQNFSGTYRAVFFNLFSEPRTIIAEFEVKADNSVTGKIKIGDEIKVFAGAVDKKGKFEAVSEKVGETLYKLKGKFDKDNKISFVQRLESGSGLNKSISENGFEGTFAKFEKPVESVQNPAALPDDGRSRLNIRQANPFFGTEWASFKAEITGKRNGTTDSWEIQVASSYPDGEQKMTMLFPKFSGTTKVWKSDFFELINYIERKANAGRNSFISYAGIYRQNPELAGGTLELIKETETRMIFRISGLKIKRAGKPDFVELNGFIYADKLKP